MTFRCSSVFVLASLATCFAGLSLAACRPTPTPGPEPPCAIYPLPTGEKVIPAVVGTPPPPSALPGETISFSFSGGYLVANNLCVCGDRGIIEYVYSDQLPGYSYRRTVEVRLDDQMVSRVGCDRDCPIAVTLPTAIGPGLHRLDVSGPGIGSELDFELLIVLTPVPAVPSSTPHTRAAPLH